MFSGGRPSPSLSWKFASCRRTRGSNPPKIPCSSAAAFILCFNSSLFAKLTISACVSMSVGLSATVPCWNRSKPRHRTGSPSRRWRLSPRRPPVPPPPADDGEHVAIVIEICEGRTDADLAGPDLPCAVCVSSIGSELFYRITKVLCSVFTSKLKLGFPLSRSASREFRDCDMLVPERILESRIEDSNLLAIFEGDRNESNQKSKIRFVNTIQLFFM